MERHPHGGPWHSGTFGAIGLMCPRKGSCVSSRFHLLWAAELQDDRLGAHILRYCPPGMTIAPAPHPLPTMWTGRNRGGPQGRKPQTRQIRCYPDVRGQMEPMPLSRVRPFVSGRAHNLGDLGIQPPWTKSDAWFRPQIIHWPLASSEFLTAITWRRLITKCSKWAEAEHCNINLACDGPQLEYLPGRWFALLQSRGSRCQRSDILASHD